MKESFKYEFNLVPKLGVEKSQNAKKVRQGFKRTKHISTATD